MAVKSDQPAFSYGAALISVHDGDTLRLDVDLGFYVHEVLDCRLYGINAPELSTIGGEVALSFVKQWFVDHPGRYVVRTVKVADHEKQDKYGRWLATVVAPDGYVLNEDLVSSGNAVVYFPK